MAGTGPPPNPNAARRNPRVGVVRLPAGGRTGRAPKWPLPASPRLAARVEFLTGEVKRLQRLVDEGDASATDKRKLPGLRMQLAEAKVLKRDTGKAERSMWAELWKTPQAVAWERLGWTREVAQYVRWKVLAEFGDLDAGKEARQYADRLGLNPKSLRTLMWQIDEDETAAKRQEREQRKTASSRKTPAGRRHMRAVDTGS